MFRRTCGNCGARRSCDRYYRDDDGACGEWKPLTMLDAASCLFSQGGRNAGKTHAREVLVGAPSNVMEVVREMTKALTLCGARFADPPSGSRSDLERLIEWEDWVIDEMRPAVDAALADAREAGIEVPE
jgi:hypothetical protein